MLISDLSVRKMLPDDPRYPDKIESSGGKPLEANGLYLLSLTLDDGRELETPCFLIRGGPIEHATPANMARVLNFFAASLCKMEEEKEAA